MLKRLLVKLRSVLSGRQLARSIRKNTEAVDQLDAVLREVLKR
jgi:hypothetical protein